MIAGVVSEDGVPWISLVVDAEEWPAIIDTGFNGGFELPEELRGRVAARFSGSVESYLAGGQRIVEDAYLVELPFDGRTVRVEATFVEEHEILIGTEVMADHRLEVDFPGRTVRLVRNSE